MRLIVDQLKKGDPQLRLLTGLVTLGLLILLTGLWWIQVVKRHDYQSDLEAQSYRTMRIPAARGKILDRNGMILAENRPTYNLVLYLEEIRPRFKTEYYRRKRVLLQALRAKQTAEEQRLGRALTSAEQKEFRFTSKRVEALNRVSRFAATSNLVAQLGAALHLPVTLNESDFHSHYTKRRALPFIVFHDLDIDRVARFHELGLGGGGVDILTQSTRFYPRGTTAAHLLGHLKRDVSSAEGESAYFYYRLPDYKGVLGIEYGYDKELRGQAGEKTILVNNWGYRHMDSIWMPPEPGKNVVLTIDVAIQEAAERALASHGPDTEGAIVVMDVRSGDILALASAPGFDPNLFVDGLTRSELDELNHPVRRPQINRATQENYAPGSIFKPIVGLACLDAGLDPHRQFRVMPDPRHPWRGIYHLGNRSINDLAAPGDYDFRRALLRSSNSYFITNGLTYGIEKVAELGWRLHLGEQIGLATRQETAGAFPTRAQLRSGWTDGKSANIFIGQGFIAVTPLQMAVMTAAIANGGNVLWPRLVARVEPQVPSIHSQTLVIPTGRVRDHLGVSRESLDVVRAAMLADVEDTEGTGRKAAVRGLRICGKTGTAEMPGVKGILNGQVVWFTSFAPYEQPRYAVVAMVEGGASGGRTCAPLVKPVYQALVARDATRPDPSLVANN